MATTTMKNADRAIETLEAAGFRVWAKNGEIRVYEDGGDRYASLEGGYSDDTLGDGLWGVNRHKCTGIHLSAVRRALKGAGLGGY